MWILYSTVLGEHTSWNKNWFWMDLNNSLLKSLPVYHFTTNHGNCKEEVYRWASSALYESVFLILCQPLRGALGCWTFPQHPEGLRVVFIKLWNCHHLIKNYQVYYKKKNRPWESASRSRMANLFPEELIFL